MRSRLLVRSALAFVAALTIFVACTRSSGSSVPTVLDPGEATNVPPATPSDPALVALARSKIKHIVYVIK